MTRFLNRQGYETSGADISAELIESNRETHPEIPFDLVENEAALPYDSEVFEVVYCSEVIEHVYDVHLFFQQIARVLRPGGLLILTTPFHGRIKNVIISLFFFERHFDPTWQHIRFWTRRSLTDVGTEHGLRPIRWKTLGRFWPVAKSYFAVFQKR